MKTETPCRVYLIRHGEVANAKEGRFNGHFDVELSQHGIEQIRKVAEQLKDKPISAIYSSNLLRTHAGAKIIAEHHDCAPLTHPELREICMGQWEGLTPGEIESKFPGELEQRMKNVETFYTEDGESFGQLRARVIPKLHEIVAANMGKTIVIMAHGGVNRIIIAHALGISAQNIFTIKQDYAAINILQYYSNTAVVELLNGSALHRLP